MNDSIDAALARCTDPDGVKLITAAPFSAVVDGRAVQVATDGHKLLMVDAPGFAGDDDVLDAFPRAVAMIRENNLTPTHRVTRGALIEWAGPDYRRPCLECDEGLVGKRECPHCDAGHLMSKLGREQDCDVCLGTGFAGLTCTDCDGSGRINGVIAPIGIPALSTFLDAYLIGGLFELLPGDDIGIAMAASQSESGFQPVSFRGDGWLLLVMPLTCETIALRDLTLTMEDVQ